MQQPILEKNEATPSKGWFDTPELVLWDKWCDEESPDTFSFLSLAKDGGFSEVKDLYTSSRWLTAAMLIIFVLYNVYALVALDLSFINDPNAAAVALGTTLDRIDKFYILPDLASSVASLFGLTITCPMQAIGVLELLGLSFIMLQLISSSMIACMAKGFRKWYAIQQIFWDILPSLSVYSAMKLLYNIVPAVLTAKVTELIGARQEAKNEGKSTVMPSVNILTSLVWVVFCFIVGFDTFLMKLRVVSAAANKESADITSILAIVQFLIQVLGVVQLGPFTRQRLFTFIFGGEDAIMQDEETALMHTWNSLLAHRMYRELEFKEFIAVMASFSDADFQSLVLNENAEQKKAELGD